MLSAVFLVHDNFLKGDFCSKLGISVGCPAFWDEFRLFGSRSFEKRSRHEALIALEGCSTRKINLNLSTYDHSFGDFIMQRFSTFLDKVVHVPI